MKSHEKKSVEILIVGAGFSGIGLAIRLKQEGFEDFLILERNSELGGTWYDNSYPGCQCDVPSHLYSFSFALNPNWSRTYSMQPEIQAYLKSCAEQADVTSHILFDHAMLGARWVDEDQRWEVETLQGTFTSSVLIAAHGGLSEPAFPGIEGMGSFRGKIIHSARWDHGSDLSGMRVGVVGTGASAVQIIPRIQPLVSKLIVFQRTPAWVLPHTDRPISERERRWFRRAPILQRALRAAIYAARELLVLGFAKNTRLLRPLRSMAIAHLARQVADPELRKKLTPRFDPGCKRLLLSNDYYRALAAPNCEVIAEPIAQLTDKQAVTPSGVSRDLDAIIFATGFRVTDNPIAGHIKGRAGQTLAEVWITGGMRGYLGSTFSKFPNFFMMTGPNTGIGHTSLLVMIEAQIAYVLDCLRQMKNGKFVTFEVRDEVVARFNRWLEKKMARTVWMRGGCASWYLDAQGRNPTLWPDFTWKFKRLTRRFDAESYVLGASDAVLIRQEAS